MRILLPPSEAKRSGGDAPAVQFGADRLGAARARAARTLSRVAVQRNAATVLALPARSAAKELAANRTVGESPTMPALDRYAGIVYEGLDAESLSRAARTRAEESILVFSGLWGVVRGGELIPDYRLAAATSLPRLGVMASYWRPVLEQVLPELLGDGLVVDLRSSDYAAMWRPGPPLRERVVAVRVLSARPGLPPAVISYPSKLGKGRLARALLGRRTAPARAAHVIDAWLTVGGTSGMVTAAGIDLII